MCWSVKQTKITVLLLLFCSVLCTHAQVSSLSKGISDSGFISYRLEGEPAHRLFLHKDTLRVEVKGIGLFPHYTLSYVIAQDGCLQRVGTPTDSKKRHRHGLVNICFAGWKMPEAYFRQ